MAGTPRSRTVASAVRIPRLTKKGSFIAERAFKNMELN